MSNKRRQFIDRLLRISQINEELLDIGERGRQPAFTKRINLIQMGKASFNLPPSAPAVHSKHNCKILILEKPTNRYLSEKNSRSRTAEGERTESTQTSPTRRDVQYCKLKLQKRRSSDACIQHEFNQINFVAPIQYQPKINFFNNPEEQTARRPRTSYKNPRRITNSAKNICLNDSQTQALNSPQAPHRNCLSGKSIKFHRTNTVSFDRDKKIESQRKAKIHKMKEINKNYAGPFNPPPKISAKSYIVCEVLSNNVKPIVCYNSKNSQEVASLTKIMTCIVTIEISQRLRINMEQQEITVGKYESSIGGTSACIKPGQIYTVKQLLYGLMLPSGNDASLALAVWAGRKLLQTGPEQKDCAKGERMTKGTCYARFIKEMNHTAKNLNMNKTKYANSHGLANPNNRSTAYDIALLSSHAMQHPIFREVVSTRSFTTTIKYKVQPMLEENEAELKKEEPQFDEFIQAKQEYQYTTQKWSSKLSSYRSKSISKIQMIEVNWQNTHKLLQSKPNEYLGIKTGVTTTAGPCLSSMVTTHNRKFVIIVLACQKVGLRFKETEVLKKWLYKHLGIIKIKRTVSFKQEKATEEGYSQSENDEQSRND